MKLTPFRASLPDPAKLSNDPNWLNDCRENYLELQATGGYVKSDKPSYYILCFRKPDAPLRYAIGGLVNVATYNQSDGEGIRPHEQTLTEKMVDHRNRILDYEAIIKPVLLTSDGGEELIEAMATACSLTDPVIAYHRWNGEVSLYTVDHPEQVTALSNLIQATTKKVAVADGHHRIATLQKLCKEKGQRYAQLPAMVMPETCLGIDTFIRSISLDSLATVDLERQFFVKLVTELTPPTDPGEWLMAHQGKVFQLTRKNTGDQLDAVWFNNIVLPDLFQITDTRNDPRIKSVEALNGIDTFQELIIKKPKKYHFLGQPLTMDDFFGCIERQELLPPKSTYFYPRVPTGLVVYEF